MAVSGLFDYTVPSRFAGRIVPGMPVQVDLRGRRVWGVAVRLIDQSQHPRLKEIIDAKVDSWSDDFQSLMQLYEWIARYYQCDLGRVFKPLVRKGIVEPPQKTEYVYRRAGQMPDNLTAAQKAALDRLGLGDGEQTRSELVETCGLSGYMVDTLVRIGALVRSERRVIRQALELRQEQCGYDIELSPEQREAAAAINAAIGTAAKPFLLYGITGSGKTHVYIECSRRALEQGLGVIILVPEISLTPQTIARFRDALGDVIAVIHSRMSDGERRDSIDELVSGRRRVVIGVRSAILAPMTRVGLIIVDEEHDGSYKQSDIDPRYHARNVAIMRGHFQNAAVVLGSATPGFESYYNAQTGKYHLIKLLNRFGEARLPVVTLVDMNDEHRAHNWTFLSRYLASRITQTLESGRQVILLLNRRGYSVCLVCKECGHIYRCPNCSVHLTFHQYGNLLRCHQCNHEEPAPETCATCQGEQIKFRGTCIQKAEEVLREQFPLARIERMDQDTTRRKGAHIDIIERFADRRIDILLGTQMVAKGLNFPGVSLVGVLQADIGMHIPDFRAAERTFQLVAQVAGRAGRQDSGGEVVIQTYAPLEPCMQASVNHDYDGFYAREIDARQALSYPPFCKLCRILVSAKDERIGRQCSEQIATALRRGMDSTTILLGPAPAVVERINGLFRFTILIKSPAASQLGRLAAMVRNGPWPRQRTVSVLIDIDPINML